MKRTLIEDLKLFAFSLYDHIKYSPQLFSLVYIILDSYIPSLLILDFF